MKNLNKTSLVSIIFILILVLSAANIVHAVEVTATIPVNFAGPIVYDSGKGEIFVTNSQDDFISVISDSTNAVVGSVTFPFEEAYGSWGIAYDSANGQIFVANQRGTVYVLSDSSNALVESVILGSSFDSHCVAYDAAEGEMFVTNNGNDTVSVLSVSPITSGPTVLGFNSVGLILVVVAVVVVTLCAVEFVVRKSTLNRSVSKQ